MLLETTGPEDKQILHHQSLYDLICWLLTPTDPPTHSGQLGPISDALMPKSSSSVPTFRPVFHKDVQTFRPHRSISGNVIRIITSDLGFLQLPGQEAPKSGTSLTKIFYTIKKIKTQTWRTKSHVSMVTICDVCWPVHQMTKRGKHGS